MADRVHRRGEQESPAPGAVGLAGELSLLSFPDLVSLMVQSRLSGVLRLTNERAERSLIFCDGELRGASSSVAEEQLGEVAERMGLVKRGDLDGLLAEADSPRRAGRVAVEAGLLSEHDLWNVMQEQVASIFRGIVRERGGSFALTHEIVPDDVTVPGLPAEALLLDVMRRLDEEVHSEASVEGGRERLESILARYNDAFRDIFATADEAGAGVRVREAAAAPFASESGPASRLQGIEFGADGDLPTSRFLEAFASAVAIDESGDGEGLLRGVLSKALLFLLFVAGEHLHPSVHEALHGRVKATVAGD